MREVYNTTQQAKKIERMKKQPIWQVYTGWDYHQQLDKSDSESEYGASEYEPSSHYSNTPRSWPDQSKKSNIPKTMSLFNIPKKD